MFWEKWPHWLKGGMTGLVIAIISIFLFTSCEYIATTSDPQSWGTGCVFFAIPVAPLYFLFSILVPPPFPPFFSPLIVYPFAGAVVWFIIGSLFNFLTGETKPKKQG
jgi:hypothetical protein